MQIRSKKGASREFATVPLEGSGANLALGLQIPQQLTSKGMDRSFFIHSRCGIKDFNPC